MNRLVDVASGLSTSSNAGAPELDKARRSATTNLFREFGTLQASRLYTRLSSKSHKYVDKLVQYTTNNDKI